MTKTQSVIFRQLNFHRNFHNSKFWVPSLITSKQTVGWQQYEIIQKDGKLTIRLKLMNLLLNFQPISALTWFCMAKGSITWSDGVASIDLEIGMKDYVLVFFFINIVFLGFFSIYGFMIDWTVGLLFLVVAFVIGVLLYHCVKYALQRFFSDLKHDIEYFKTNSSTRQEHGLKINAN